MMVNTLKFMISNQKNAFSFPIFALPWVKDGQKDHFDSNVPKLSKKQTQKYFFLSFGENWGKTVKLVLSIGPSRCPL